MKRLLFALALAACGLLSVAPPASAAAAAAAEPQPFELKDGDLVTIIGNTFAEREQSYSYLETLLLTRWPDRNIRFRNLGWSGDTVHGHARGYFGWADEGFNRLNKVVHELKPTVVFLCYGMAESYDGERGLPQFQDGLNKLLDMLADLNARTVLVGPIRHEDLGPPFPKPDRHNRQLRLYADAMKATAEKRGARFVDLYELLGDGMKGKPAHPFTENGVHLTPYGYWRAAAAIEKGLGLPPRGWTMDLGELRTVNDDGQKPEGVEASKGNPENGKITLRLRAPLPAPPAPPNAPEGAALPGHGRVLRWPGLDKGKQYALKVGDRVVAVGTAEQWAEGVAIRNDPAAGRAEQIRRLAVAKNFQYFNQWRPANETYIFGFRSGEQGRNAVEMPQFDKPIAELEAKIAELRKPVEQAYVLEPVK